MQDSMNESPKKMIANLIFNIALPVTILSKLSGPESLGPLNAMLFALSFPVFFGIYELKGSKKINPISVLGVVNVLLTGVLAIFKFGSLGFAVKEASIPLTIGLAILFTLKRDKNFVHLLIFNDRMLSIDLILEKVEEFGVQKKLKKLIYNSGLFFVASFMISAILNFGLAVVILKSEPQTEAFNQELARMTALSFPVIMIPSMAVLILAFVFLMRGLSKLTKLGQQELFKGTLAK